MSPLVTRFAPSPTGPLHLGHAYSALLAFARARRDGGRFLLRIEDIDVGRCRPEHDVAILEDLAWLGLEWEQPVWRQSGRMAAYAEALARLQSLGIVYPCFCTRKQIRDEIAASPSAPHGPDGPLYPGTCRGLSPDQRAERVAAGEAHAWRLDAAAAAAIAGGLAWHDEIVGEVAVQPGLNGDVVLARKDVPTGYHLAVTVDDAAQGISLVVRGQDLFAASHVHRLLQELLGLPSPRYCHHELIRDSEGRRLASRDGALSLARLRADGVTPADIRRRLGLA